MSKVVVKQGMRWKIGDGSHIPLWDSPWLRGGQVLKCPPNMPHHVQPMKINALWSPTSKDWNAQYVHDLFPAPIVSSILRTPLHSIVNDDMIIWGGSNNGIYSSCQVCV